MGTLLLSRWSSSVHLVRGRPGGRLHVRSGGRPTDSSTWRSMACCAGMLSGNLATCPNMALRPLVIRSDTGARPVRTDLRVTDKIMPPEWGMGLLYPRVHKRERESIYGRGLSPWSAKILVLYGDVCEMTNSAFDCNVPLVYVVCVTFCCRR